MTEAGKGPGGPFDLSEGMRSRTRLRDGADLPVLGFGVWQIPPGAPTRQAVEHALAEGYRAIDTATLYRNEADVAAAIRTSGIPREELFVTTKLWNDDQGSDRARAAFERSRAALDGTIDLYLIHWPVRAHRVASWRTLVALQNEGAVRSIGVSNFTAAQLEELIAETGIVPSVDQIECSPFLYPSDIVGYCRDHGIQVISWSPLHRGRGLDHPVLQEIAHRHRKTPAQVVLRWHLQHDLVTIPKSQHAERIRENRGLFDFALVPEEVRAIDGLDAGDRVGPDPSAYG